MLRTGGNRGPDSLAPFSPAHAAGALGYAAIDHDVANRLLGRIIGGLQAKQDDWGLIATFLETHQGGSGLWLRSID